MTTIERATRASDAQRQATKRREGRFDENGVSRPALRAFQDPGDPVTIGWGHTLDIEIKGVRRKPRLGDQITPEYADKLFEIYGAPMAENRVDKFFPGVALTQGMRDALFDFCYNMSLKTLDAPAYGRKFTLGSLVKAGQVSAELMLEWFPKYRNPKTIFEQGLYRRRLWNACVFLGCDIDIAEQHAWTAEFKRDDRGDVSFATDPQLIFMRAKNDTDKRRKAEEDKAAAETEKEQPAAPVAADEKSQREDREEPSTEPRETEPSAPPVETPRGYEEPKPAPKPVYKNTLPPSPKAPAADPDEIQVSRPEFWSLQLLLFGRVALAFGLVPGVFGELILDPSFQSAFGGAIAIYLAMFFRERSRRQAERKRKAQLEAS